uniref:Reverse transcriptase domain-containing protein n=1 Tax=Panagrolaimus davidi TaxID=227884 RepID=A0A914PZZ3_9BILA
MATNIAHLISEIQGQIPDGELKNNILSTFQNLCTENQNLRAENQKLNHEKLCFENEYLKQMNVAHQQNNILSSKIIAFQEQIIQQNNTCFEIPLIDSTVKAPANMDTSSPSSNTFAEPKLINESVTGVVKFFNIERKYGIINFKTNENGTETLKNAFIHATNISKSNIEKPEERNLKPDETVIFDLYETRKDKYVAKNVTGPEGENVQGVYVVYQKQNTRMSNQRQYQSNYRNKPHPRSQSRPRSLSIRRNQSNDYQNRQIFRSRQGGGVAILIYSKLHYIPINHDYQNIIAVDIIQNQNSSTRYILIYRPPNFSKPQSIKLFDNVREIIHIPSIFPIKNYILLGDFNYPHISWDSDLSTQSGDASPLIDFMLEKQLHQHVKEPTRKNNILDLILSSDPQSVMDIQINDPIGDHNVIYFKTSNEYDSINEKHDYKDFKNGDYDGLNNYFISINWESELNNVLFSNDKYERIRKKIIDGISKFIPTRIYDPAKNIPKNLQNSMNFYVKFSSNPSKSTIINQSIKKLNKEFIKFTKNQQRKLFLKRTQESNAERKNVKNLFNYVSPFLKQKTSNIPIFFSNDTPTKKLFSDKEKADTLGKFFASVYNPWSPPENVNTEIPNVTLNHINFNEFEIVKMLKKCSSKNDKGVDNIPGYVLNQCAETLCKPLRILFNSMMDSPDDVPNLFLLSYVTPIPKIPKPLNVENFRPISGTSDILKTFERCIKIVLVGFLEHRNYFPKQQYGFRAKKSTIKQLIPFQEFIISSVSKKMTVDVIYFDWLKAFDKIPIDRLIRALKKAGITGNLLKIIIMLLSSRKFKVKVGKTFSDTFNATSGVPQGSVLGPVLFIIFITELSDILSNLPGILHLLFADDLKIYFAYFKNSFDISIIQNAINAVFNWSSENSMTTSTSKTFHMQYCPKNEDAKYLINNTQISTVTIVRDLGIMLENNLQPHAHIKKIVGSAMASMFSIIKRVLISSTDVLIFLFNVYVRPILEYGTQLFNI